MSFKEFTSKRFDAEDIEIVLDGERFILRPGKKSEAMVNILAVDRSDPSKEIGYTKALLEWFEKSLDRKHGKTRKQPGHGDESIPGCQACRMYDRLNDDDDPLDLDTVFEAANWALGELADRPTGKPSA